MCNLLKCSLEQRLDIHMWQHVSLGLYVHFDCRLHEMKQEKRGRSKLDTAIQLNREGRPAKVAKRGLNSCNYPRVPNISIPLWPAKLIGDKKVLMLVKRSRQTSIHVSKWTNWNWPTLVFDQWKASQFPIV